MEIFKYVPNTRTKVSLFGVKSKQQAGSDAEVKQASIKVDSSGLKGRYGNPFEHSLRTLTIVTYR